MKKYIKYTTLALLLIFMISCSDSGNGAEGIKGEGYAKFSKTEISVSCNGGQASVTLVWDNVEWEIEASEESFITNLSPSSGGSIGSSNLTTISFTVSENNSTNERSTEIYAINKDTQEKETITITQETLPIAVLSPNTKYQDVVGFGGMYNPAVWITSESRIDANELATMYDPNGQLKYSVLRLMIYADDSKWAEDVEGALQAQNYGATIFACPWDCTVALDDTIEVNGEKYKHLPAENYEAYADHLIAYVDFMKSKGVNIYAISVQNEPDMHFTYWTPEEIASFTANYGGKIREAGVKLMSPEACGFQSEYTDAIINSADAYANTDIIAGHTYQGFTDLSSSYVKSRHDYVCNLYPNYLSSAGKSWWMTEKLFGSYGDDLDNGDYKKWSYNLEKLGLEMHMCMDGYCSAYVYWYLKRFYGMIGDVLTHDYVEEGEVMKNGYIMAHYSAYATGMTRINIDVGDEEILATAYVNEIGDEITVVALNMTENKLVTLIEAPGTVSSHDAIETTEDYNMKDVETSLTDDLKHVRLSISPRSIYSLKIKL